MARPAGTYCGYGAFFKISIDTMTHWIAIAGGGALGALLRYWSSNATYAWLGRDFPYGTLLVNVVGCLLMGLGTSWLVDRVMLSDEARAFLLVGVLGAFTTFSTFSYETLALFETGAWIKALLNIALSVILCMLAVAAGVLMGRQL